MTIPWLQELEERVGETAARLRELRAENETLRQRVAELEGELASAPDGKERETWVEERAEIRSRVEQLAEHLEKLLEDDDDG